MSFLDRFRKKSRQRRDFARGGHVNIRDENVDYVTPIVVTSIVTSPDGNVEEVQEEKVVPISEAERAGAEASIKEDTSTEQPTPQPEPSYDNSGSSDSSSGNFGSGSSGSDYGSSSSSSDSYGSSYDSGSSSSYDSGGSSSYDSGSSGGDSGSF